MRLIRAGERHGDGVATTKTKRLDTRCRFQPSHDTQHRDEAAGTACAQGMAEADGAAVEVEATLGNANLLGNGT